MNEDSSGKKKMVVVEIEVLWIPDYPKSQVN